MQQERTAIVIGELDCSKIDQSFFDALLAILEKKTEQKQGTSP